MDTSSSVAAERDCNALGGLFHIIVTDLRGGTNNWDDLLVKANKFHVQLKATIGASTAFLDAFQKIADLATTTRGGTKEIGSALTRLCLRHRSVEAKLKSYTNSMLDSFILPLQDRVEEWKRLITQMDKDHSKELKRLKQFKKQQKQSTENGRNGSTFSNTTFRIKRNSRSKMKTDFGRVGSMYDLSRLFDTMEPKEKYFMLEEVERNYVRRALIEERSHYCLFFNFLRPVIEEQISMLQEVTHLEEVLSALAELTKDPYHLPPASESLLTKLHLNESTSLDQVYGELESPLYRSRKSSISSITSINSLSTDCISLQNCKSLSQPNITPNVFRPKSIASQDSGFISHDYNVPNIGRLTIAKGVRPLTNVENDMRSNVKSISRHQSSSSSTYGTLHCKELSNQRKSIAACKDCVVDVGEYASSDQLFTNTIRMNRDKATRSVYVTSSSSSSSSPLSSLSSSSNGTKNPIYANVHDDHHCETYTTPNGQTLSIRNSSDGSITPTNQYSTCNILDSAIYSSRTIGNYQTVNEMSISSRPQTAPKTNPPKPPTRISSTLSSSSSSSCTNHGNTKPPIHSPNSNNNGSGKSTLIYVVQENGNMPDFPPPPPEAYINYATPNHETVDNVNMNNGLNGNHNGHQSNSCCDYGSLNNNGHLVLCNDVNCIQSPPSGPTFGHDNQSEHYGSTVNCNNSNNINNNRKSIPFINELKMRNPNLEPVLRQIYSDRNVGTIRTSNVQQTNGTELNVNSTRLFHSTINLSNK